MRHTRTHPSSPDTHQRFLCPSPRPTPSTARHKDARSRTRQLRLKHSANSRRSSSSSSTRPRSTCQHRMQWPGRGQLQAPLVQQPLAALRKAGRVLVGEGAQTPPPARMQPHSRHCMQG